MREWAKHKETGNRKNVSEPKMREWAKHKETGNRKHVRAPNGRA